MAKSPEKLVLPLWFQPEDLKNGLESDLTLHGNPDAGNGKILITAENLADLEADLAVFDKPRFRIFDMLSDARLANILIGEGEDGPRSSSIVTQINTLRDGEGVLMSFDADGDVMDADFEATDYRTRTHQLYEIYGSWELSLEENLRLMAPRELNHRMDLAQVIADKLASFPSDVVMDIQVALERIPGTFVGFLNLSPADIRVKLEAAGIDSEQLPDDQIQTALSKAASKSEMMNQLQEAVEDTVERLRNAHPEVFDQGSGEEMTP